MDRHLLRILTSTQRFGNAVVSSGNLNLRNQAFAEDFGPVEEGCTCSTCRPKDQGGLGISRAYLHHLAAKETVGAHLYDLPLRLWRVYPMLT